MQVNDINDAAMKGFSTKLAAAAAGGVASRVELHSAVHDAKYMPFAAGVNGLSACPHHVSPWLPAGTVPPCLACT